MHGGRSGDDIIRRACKDCGRRERARRVELSGEERISGVGDGGEAGAAAHGTGSGRGQKGCEVAQFGAGMADGCGDGIETLRGPSR